MMDSKTDQLKTQQWWADHIISPMMNSHRLNSTLIEHQLKGYDEFVFRYVPDIFHEYSKISFWYGCIPPSNRLEFLPQDKRQFALYFIKFQFSPVWFRRSPLTIRQCHLQDETYQFDVLSNVSVTILDLHKRRFILKNRLLFSNVLVCSIPIMVRSKMCNTSLNGIPATEILDPGGYFILNGKEKVIIAQEEFKYNYPFVMKPTSLIHNRYSWKCEVRSWHYPILRSSSTIYILLTKQTNDVDIQLPFCQRLIPILAIFRMMDIEKREDVLAILCKGSTNPLLIDIMVRITDHDVRTYPKHKLAQIFVPKSSTVEKVIEHAQANEDNEDENEDAKTKEKEGLKRKSLFQNTLTNEFFPHIGKQWTVETNLRKLKFLAFCIRKLVLTYLKDLEKTEGKSQEKTKHTIFTGRLKHVPDNADILDNKRVKCTGYLLGKQLRQIVLYFKTRIFCTLRTNFKKQLAKRKLSKTPGSQVFFDIECLQQYILYTKTIRMVFEQRKITDQLNYEIATGNWIANKVRHQIITITSKSNFMNNESKTPGQADTATSVIDQSGSNNPNSRVGIEYRQTYATDQTGVAQSLTRNYPMTVLSHLRRVNKNINRKSKSVGPRLLNESQWGIYCGVSTPEGKACGHLPQLALLCHIRHMTLTTSELIFQVLHCLESIEFKEGSQSDSTLFVNYVPLVQVQTDDMERVLQALRYKAFLPFDASIFLNDTDDVTPQIHVVYDHGACLRPIISLKDSDNLVSVVQNTPLVDLWPELIKRNIVQYKTREEEFCGLFSVSSNLLSCLPEHTHLEIYHPGLFSPEILIIPFMNHNQSPRNMFAMNLLRQSVGDIGYNHFNRFDSHIHRLWYPQQPLVQTSQDRDWNLSELPAGVNCIVQMMCMPYNMEDAIIVNRAALDRGLFRSDIFETFTSTDDPNQGVHFARPDFYSVTNLQNVNYQTVDPDGLPPQGEPIQKRDVIIGRVSIHDSKSVKQSQAHALNSSVPSVTPIPSVTQVPSVTKVSSVTPIPSVTKVSSVKSFISDQSEQDMKTLRNHLSFIQTHDGENDNNRSRLAILENLQKTKTHQNTSRSFQKDHSIVMQKELFQQKMVVDAALLTQNSHDPSQRITKIRLRQTRIPEVGDKLSSRHGQKGVIGRIMHPEDLPFTADGQVADLIINPHCMPSRMTIGQLLESLSGKALALNDQPKKEDSNIFPCDFDSADYFGHDITHASCCHPTLPKIQQYTDILRKKGYDIYGNEPMFDGTTGKLLQNRGPDGRLHSNEAIFIGVVFYQRLRHMVADKLYARSKGAVQLTTRQPNEGRSAEGGLRLGEMERDVLISHGATQVLRDEFLNNSDRYDTLLCNRCGLFANAASQTCSVCHEKADLQRVTIPYPLKLLKQELAPAGIYMHFSSQKSPDKESIFD